jgi:nucleotide-binding universal stress UspA family protein
MTRVQQGRPSRVVVGVDGSTQSMQALRWAAHYAASVGAGIDVVAAWQYPTAYEWSPIQQDWDPEQDMEKMLTEVVDEVFGAHRPHDIRLAVREGNAARLLLAESADALMLVVGSRGHGGFTGLLLGSVSSNVAEHATCPVLVIHGNQNPPEATT